MEANAMLVKNTDDKQKAIQELTDQVRDIKFFLDARETVQDHPELEGGSVETHIPQTRHTKRRGKRS
jgi:BRCA1-associated protein